MNKNIQKRIIKTTSRWRDVGHINNQGNIKGKWNYYTWQIGQNIPSVVGRVQEHKTHYHSRDPRKGSRELKYADSMIHHGSNETVTQVPRGQAAFLAVTGYGSNLNVHNRSDGKKKLYAHISEKLNCGHKQEVI